MCSKIKLEMNYRLIPMTTESKNKMNTKNKANKVKKKAKDINKKIQLFNLSLKASKEVYQHLKIYKNLKQSKKMKYSDK